MQQIGLDSFDCFMLYASIVFMCFVNDVLICFDILGTALKAMALDKITVDHKARIQVHKNSPASL